MLNFKKAYTRRKKKNKPYGEDSFTELAKVEFKKVLLIKDDKNVEVGSPIIDGAIVEGLLLDNIKDKKIIVFKKRRTHNSRRKNGHRQSLSIVQIEEISINGSSFKNQDLPGVIVEMCQFRCAQLPSPSLALRIFSCA